MTTDAIANEHAAMVVIDTNRVLDLWLFDDPQVTALRQVVRGGAVRWLATAAMRGELARVLGYPPIAAQLQRRRRDAAQVLAAFDRWARLMPVAPSSAVRCADADDQMFIDLALSQGARWLLSRDRALLKLARKAAVSGLLIQTPEAWRPELDADADTQAER